jgi:hypothetical protein
MTQVGLFIVKDHKSKFMKKKIFNKLMDIFGDDHISNVAYGENADGLDMIYVFLNIEKQKEIYDLFTQYDILNSYKNLTKEFLYQENLNSIFNEGDFKEVLVNFLNNNLDQDTILDKINELGIDSLNEVDYKILQK